MRTKVILDTDIGSDIDDSVCLAYLLAQPACELMGITTVTGESHKRAAMADALCRVAGKEIPIFPGLESPLIVAPHQPQATQSPALAKWPHRERFESGQAIDFLRQTIRGNPNEIVLLGIGPMTNIATLFAMDPEIPALLKSLVVMAGNYTPVRWRHAGYIPTEWNVLNDPHAATIVFRSPVPTIRCIGVDVTSQVTMSPREVRDRFQSKLLRPVLDFAEIWFQGAQKEITFHDPLAATTIFDERICAFEHGNIEIELTSERLAGFTYWNPASDQKPHQVAVNVDVPRFFEHYFGRFD